MPKDKHTEEKLKYSEMKNSIYPIENTVESLNKSGRAEYLSEKTTLSEIF